MAPYIRKRGRTALQHDSIIKYIYIHQLLDDDLKEIIIKYNDVNYSFHRIELINSFKFYRSPKDVEKFVAIRWHSPWKYVAMIEFQGFEIKGYLKVIVKRSKMK